MVRGKKNLFKIEFIAGSMKASLQAKTNKALRLVEGHPAGNTISKLINHDLGVVSKPICRISIEPSTLQIKFVWHVPVEKCHVGLNAIRKQLV